MRKQVIYLVVLVGLILGSFLFRYQILGGVGTTNLKVNPISGPVSKSLQGPPGNYKPIEGKDYEIKQVKYFNNKQWVYVSVAPIAQASDAGVIVLNKQNNSYQTVFGPSNDFRGVQFNSLPNEVIQYIQENM